MTNNITVKDKGEVVFNKEPATGEIDACGTVEFNTTLKGKNLKGWYKEQVFENFKIGYGTLQTNQKDILNFDFQGKTIEMLFIMKGSFTVNFHKRIKNNYYEPNEHAIFYYTSTSGFIDITDSKISIVRINLSLDFFNQFLPEDNKFKDFRKQIEKNKTGKLKKQNHPITSKMHVIIDGILNSKWEGFYRKIHMNAIVLELLLLQLEQFNKERKKELKTYDDEKIVKVYEYIAKNFTKPMTLHFLSKKFGTNEFALKKGFKSMFGITVFGYIADLKMQKARDLLIEKQLPVGEVSEIVGYKNPQHFSTAFKKKFGVTPSKFMSLN